MTGVAVCSALNRRVAITSSG